MPTNNNTYMNHTKPWERVRLQNADTGVYSEDFSQDCVQVPYIPPMSTNVRTMTSLLPNDYHGSDVFDTPFNTDLLPTEHSPLQVSLVTRQGSFYVESVSPLGVAIPTHHCQYSHNLANYAMMEEKDYQSIDSQCLQSNNKTFSFIPGGCPGAEHTARTQVEDLQPRQGMSFPNSVDVKDGSVMPFGGHSHGPCSEVLSLHTIGYVCDEEDSDYVFKCGDFACFHKSFGRWSDLKRHYEGAHAVSRRAAFWYEVQGCERSEACGSRPFPRKDKLGDHVRKVHYRNMYTCRV